VSQEAKHKHLEFIQEVINRLGSNSFQTKSWAITIVAAIFVLAADKDADARLQLLFVSLIPVIIFWVLDGYFLWQERLFRKLYEEVAKVEDDAKIDFQMNVGIYNNGRNTWLRSVFSKTLNIFYFTLLVLMAVIALVISSI
jgi:hypothetical protein